MSITSRTTTDKEQKTTPRQTGKLSALLRGNYRCNHAVSDSWIISSYSEQFFITDIEAKTNDQSEVPVHKLAKTSSNDYCSCVSQDGQWLVEITRADVRTFYLGDMVSVEDTHKIKINSFAFSEELFSPGFTPQDVFFIGDNSHVVVWSNWLTAIAIVNISNGRVTKKRIGHFQSLCLLGENRLVSAHGEDGLFVHDFQIIEGEIIFSKAVKLNTLDKPTFNHCTASPDGRFLAARIGRHDKPNLIEYWEIQPDGELLWQNTFRCSSSFMGSEHYAPFFTCDNTLVYEYGHSEIHRVEHDSLYSLDDNRQTTVICINLPNGNLLAIDLTRNFRIIPGNKACSIYQAAFTQLMQMIEMSGVLPFSSDLLKLVSDYASDSRFFSRSKIKKTDEAAFQRSALEKVLDRLLLDLAEYSTDKDVLRKLKSRLASKNIYESVSDVLQEPLTSEGLEEFLERLRLMFQGHVARVQRHKS